MASTAAGRSRPRLRRVVVVLGRTGVGRAAPASTLRHLLLVTLGEEPPTTTTPAEPHSGCLRRRRTWDSLPSVDRADGWVPPPRGGGTTDRRSAHARRHLRAD